MTVWAEFEEKTYESFFGHELRLPPRQTFSPGQHAEHDLGFDAAFKVPWLKLLLRFPHLYEKWWRRLPGISPKDFGHLSRDIANAMPAFKFNLFAQFKRPEYVMGHMGTEWPHWGQPYYRYKLVAHQHDALRQIDQASAGLAATIYASAAFTENDKLYEYAGSDRLISQSNIASVDSIGSAHQTFTYIEPGTFGIACSDPEEIESSSIEEIFRTGLEGAPIRFTDFTIKTAGIIDDAIAENEIGQELHRNAAETFLHLWNLDDYLWAADEDPDITEFVQAMTSIWAFCSVYNVHLTMVGA